MAVSTIGCGLALYLIKISHYTGGITLFACANLFFFILILMTLLIADYADTGSTKAASIILTILSALSLMICIPGMAVVHTGITTMPFCAALLILNATMFALSVRIFRHEMPAHGMAVAVREVVKKWDTPLHRVTITLCILCVMLLIYSLYSTITIARLRDSGPVRKPLTTAEIVEKFYSAPVESLDFPETPLVAGAGSASLNIQVFFDFECGACAAFYGIQKKMTEKYGSRIKFSYYHYPLDISCNAFITNNIHPTACQAARGMTAAALAGKFEQALGEYFSIEGSGSERTAGWIKSPSGSSMVHGINSKSVKKTVAEHISFAARAKTEGTPTIFINKRRNVGYLPPDAMDAIIARELSGK